jgi:hypothetical protein
MYTSACDTHAGQCQLAEVMCNGWLETDSLSLALSTRVTVHELWHLRSYLTSLHVH